MVMNSPWDINSFSEITGEKIGQALEVVRGEVPASPVVELGKVIAKLESHNPTGAFKVRGGLIYFDWLKSMHPEVNTAIAATRGNHGQSVAFAAGQAGLQCRIVVPQGNSPLKNHAMEKLGAELIVHGADFAEAMEYAAELGRDSSVHFVPSFDWKLVLGVATYGYELFEACPGLEAVYVPIGLGSGICGTIAARNAAGSRAKIIGVVADRAPAYAESVIAGRLVEGREIPDTIADGVACRVPNPDSLQVILEEVDEVIRIGEVEIESAMRELHRMGHRTEGAGAIAYAAWKSEPDRWSRPGVILSGGNIDDSWFGQ